MKINSFKGLLLFDVIFFFLLFFSFFFFYHFPSTAIVFKPNHNETQGLYKADVIKLKKTVSSLVLRVSWKTPWLVKHFQDSIAQAIVQSKCVYIYKIHQFWHFQNIIFYCTVFLKIHKHFLYSLEYLGNTWKGIGWRTGKQTVSNFYFIVISNH